MMKKFIGYASVFIVSFSGSAIAFDNEQLIALNNSDIAGTCWTTSYSSGIVQRRFNSNGTFEQIQLINNPSSAVIWRGAWKISSNAIWERVTDTTVAGVTRSAPNSKWEHSFVVRNGRLINSSGYVFTLGCN